MIIKAKVDERNLKYPLNVYLTSITFCCSAMSTAVLPAWLLDASAKYYYFIKVDGNRQPVEDRVHLAAIDSKSNVLFCPYCGEKVEVQEE